MKEFDADGLELAIFQAELFQRSVEECKESSPIFLRRFFLSDYAYTLDDEEAAVLNLDQNAAFQSLQNQYGDIRYGKIKYSEDGLYWLGYFTRYVCYTREMFSRAFYHMFDVKEIYSLYESYHTQSEEWCLAHLLDKYGYTEADLDKNERLKKALRKQLNLVH